MFHLTALYSFNKSTHFHFLQINQSLPMWHDIFIRGHSEQDYYISCDNKSIVLSQNVSRFACPFNISMFQFHFATTIPLFILKLKKVIFSSVHNVHMLVRTTCYQISDVTCQFFQNLKIWITHFLHFKHIQLFKFP